MALAQVVFDNELFEQAMFNFRPPTPFRLIYVHAAVGWMLEFVVCYLLLPVLDF
jgi:hypothetical protein